MPKGERTGGLPAAEAALAVENEPGQSETAKLFSEAYRAMKLLELSRHRLLTLYVFPPERSADGRVLLPAEIDDLEKRKTALTAQAEQMMGVLRGGLRRKCLRVRR